MGRSERKRVGTSARQFLYPDFVGDLETSPAVVDKISLSQTLRDTRDAGPVNSEHASDVFVSDLEFVATASSLERQEPAAKSLFDRMERVADHSL